MPDIDMPTWVEWLLIAGLVAGAATTIVRTAIRTGKGMGWLRDSAREAIAGVAREALADVVQDRVAVVVDERVATAVDDLEAKLAPELAQLASNGGQSVRDRVEDMQGELAQLTREFRAHVAYAERRRPEPGDTYDDPHDEAP